PIRGRGFVLVLACRSRCSCGIEEVTGMAPASRQSGDCQRCPSLAHAGAACHNRFGRGGSRRSVVVGPCADAEEVTMVSWVGRQGGAEGSGGRRGSRGAAHGIRTQACTLLLAVAMATVVPAAHEAGSGIKAAGGRYG